MGHPLPALPPRPGGVNGGPGARTRRGAAALCLKLPLKLGPRHLPVLTTGWSRSVVERGRGKSCAKKKKKFSSPVAPALVKSRWEFAGKSQLLQTQPNTLWFVLCEGAAPAKKSVGG